MTKLRFGLAMAVIINLAIIIVLVADGILIVEGDDGGPPSVIATLKTEEGFRAKPYLDTRGFLTVGYGSRIDEELSPAETACLGHDNPPLSVTEDQADCLLRVHVKELDACLGRSWPPLRSAGEWERYALLLMGYQIGCHGVLGFHDMLAALARGDTEAAIQAALDSDWDEETPRRALLVVGALRGS